jgi:primosomal protein N' (replication factor Y) (superfamily II helicase)
MAQQLSFLQQTTSSSPESASLYVEVLVDVDVKIIDRRRFTYKVPEHLRQEVDIGTPVSVPFGKQPLVTGYVVGLNPALDATVHYRDILDVLDALPLFNEAYIQFLDWVANYYVTPLMTVLMTALPSCITQKTKRLVALCPDLPTHHIALTPLTQSIITYLQARKKPVGLRFLASQLGLGLKKMNEALFLLKQAEYIDIYSETSKATQEKTSTWILLHPEKGLGELSKRQKQLLEGLQQLPDGPAFALNVVLENLKTTRQSLHTLSSLGYIQFMAVPVNRAKAYIEQFQSGRKTHHGLNTQQAEAVQAVLQAPAHSEYLLYGVTGSGKTEVYIELTQAMLAENKATLILVPEISLTSHIAKRFIERFGLDQIALWHSQLSAGEKADTWRKVTQGDLKIVIGARSAIFTPLKNLGLIVMDEEHEGSYKQDSPAPRYHARTLARYLVEHADAKLLLGSATPDLEAYYHAVKNKTLLRIEARFGGRTMADVQVVQTQSKASKGQTPNLSAQLEAALKNRIERQEQTVLLLNRRGFYTLVTCQECEHTVDCPHCSVSMTHHKKTNTVRCHYCGFETPRPQFCKHCASTRLTFTGVGTQRLEEELHQALPEATLLRIDSDSLSKKMAHHHIFDAFERHEADILIGTQMVAKGLNVPNVTLVGVIQADSAFSLPDYKATERGFQLLTQVAGRAGRGEKPGQVIIQSAFPNHRVIQRAKAQDYEGFYADELPEREQYNFPPFSQLFRLIASGENEEQVLGFMEAVALSLRNTLSIFNTPTQQTVELQGPAPCVIERIQGRYRYHIMVKNAYENRADVHQAIRAFFLETNPPETINFLLDVDAQSFL